MKSLVAFVLNIFFPKFCCGCGTLETYLCPRCYNTISLIALPLTLDLTERKIDEVYAVSHFEGTVRSLIHTLKYTGVRDVAHTIARFMYYVHTIETVDYITAVPLHEHRFAERGFNQSEEIAQELAHLLKKKYLPVLIREKYTQAQASLSDKIERQKNVANTFVFVESYTEAITNKTILIIDDVCTTGSTLNECATVLKKAGADRVTGLVLAHGN